MTNEEQLREEWMRGHWQNPWRDLDPDENEAIADWRLRKLHEEELNWITGQIERGEGMLASFNNPPKTANRETDGWYNHALINFLTPLIERKKELEEIIGQGEK